MVIDTIKQAMAEQGVTIYRLAQLTRMHNETIRVALSEQGNPKLSTLRAICDALNLELRVDKKNK